MTKVYFKTYGCTLNQADTEAMQSIVNAQVVNEESEADVIVVNTCAVKGPTEAKIVHYLNTLKQQGKKFIIAGCLTANKGLVSQYNVPVISTTAISHINDALKDVLEGKQSFYYQLEKKENLPKTFSPPIGKIPIQEGCFSSCHFCFTKLARKYQSRSPGSIVRWIKQALMEGCREIDLTGTDLGTYGRDVGSNLVELLKLIVQIEGDFRVRLGMGSPQYYKQMLPDLLDIYDNKKIFKFFHLSIQSGSEKVVREMNRGHTVQDWIDVLKAFRGKYGIEFTAATDIIVGYPTETEEDFELTLRFLEKYRPDVVNLSKFTPRPFTEAAKLRQLPSEVIKKRSILAHEVIKKVNLENNLKHVGKTYQVLVTEEKKGRTNFYRQVVLDKEIELGGFVDVEIYDASPTSLFGKVI